MFGGEKFASLAELVHFYTTRQGVLREKNGEVIDLKYPLYTEDIITERLGAGTGDDDDDDDGNYCNADADFLLNVMISENILDD